MLELLEIEIYCNIKSCFVFPWHATSRLRKIFNFSLHQKDYYEWLDREWNFWLKLLSINENVASSLHNFPFA